MPFDAEMLEQCANFTIFASLKMSEDGLLNVLFTLGIGHVDEALRKVHEDGLRFVVNFDDEVIGGGYHELLAIVVNDEEHVGGLVVDVCDFAQRTEVLVDDLVADVAGFLLGVGIVLFGLFGGETTAVEVEFLATEGLSFGLRVNVLEREEYGLTRTKAEVLDEKGNEDAVHVEDEVGTFLDIVKDGVGDGSLHLAMESVEFGDVADGYELVRGNHLWRL